MGLGVIICFIVTMTIMTIANYMSAELQEDRDKRLISFIIAFLCAIVTFAYWVKLVLQII